MFLRLNNGTELVNPHSVNKATISERDGKPQVTLIINGAAHDYFGEEALDAFEQLRAFEDTPVRLTVNGWPSPVESTLPEASEPKAGV